MHTQKSFLIAGNWKMNKTAAETVTLIQALQNGLPNKPKNELLICPPFTSLFEAQRLLRSSEMLSLGAQNAHPKPSGAYTGEISIPMLEELHVRYILIGHSERRLLFNETNKFINEKVRAVLSAGLKPVLCVGETLEQRKSNQTFSVIENQLLAGLREIEAKEASSITVAYEPVWAIGTGETATPELAQTVHAFIRQWLSKRFNETSAASIRLLYGGSLKPENAKELLMQKDIDGGLIGGASLDAKAFLSIFQTAEAIAQENLLS